MAIVRRNNQPLSTGYRPTPQMDDLGRLVENMFEEFLSPYSGLARLDADATITPRVNVTETEKSFEVDVEVPGASKEDVKVAIDGRRVTIEADARKEDRKEGDNVIYAERLITRFARTFMLPAEVDDTNAQARIENGVLHLSLPKKGAQNARRLTVQ